MPTLRLIETATGRELSPGDTVELRDTGKAYIYEIKPGKGRVMVTPEDDNDKRGGGAIEVHPAAIGATFL